MACTNLSDRPIAITGSYEGATQVWGLKTGAPLRTLTRHTGTLFAMACTVLDGRPIGITTSCDDTARVWDLATGTALHTLTGHTGTVKAVACIVIDGHPIAITTGSDHTARVWELTSGAVHMVHHFVVALSDSMAVGPGHEVVITAGREVTVIARTSRQLP